MNNETKFHVEAGNLLTEIVELLKALKQQMQENNERIQTIVAEQSRGNKGGKAVAGRRRGRPPKAGRRGPKPSGQRPGRQPLIVRDSSLELKPRQLSGLGKFVQQLAVDGKLGKDAAVFAVAYYLCKEVFGGETFTAGDVIKAYRQLGATAGAPDPETVDVVQMLRNLSAVSIGKEWVVRNPDGTFSLTQKGKEVGATGNVFRPRGRRPAGERVAASGAPKKRGRKPGRPAGSGRGPGRPPKRRGPGRPPKNAK